MKRYQDQYTSDEERMKRADREARNELMVMICFYISIPIILLLMGYIAFCGQQNMW